MLFGSWTDHAREQLAERVVALAPDDAIAEMRRGAQRGDTVELWGQRRRGENVWQVFLSTGQVVFVLTDRNGDAITVLSEGMEITTSTGRAELIASHLPPGIHRVPAARYHSDPHEKVSLSSTLARALLDHSPLHAWWAHPRLNPDWTPTIRKSFDIGHAAHREALGAGGDYVEIPTEILASNGAASTKAAKAFIEEARAEGMTPIKAEEVEQIQAMGIKLRAKLDQNGIEFDPANSEVTALAVIDGCPVRCMVDNAPLEADLPLWDFKTTTNAALDAVMRSIMTYGYDVQAAHYLDVWKAATGEDRRFRFVFQEKEPPFEVQIVELGPETVAMGRRKIERAREIWRRCVESGHWPGYPAGVSQIELPDFYHGRWLERESVEADYKRQFGHDILDAARRWQAPEGVA